MLSEMLKKEYIKLNQECNDWKDAIRQAGNILLEKEIVTEEYIDNTIKTIEMLGPYVVVTKGIAVPHCSGSFGVNKNGIALMTLKEPIEFGNLQNDPVYCIFLFANNDINIHIDALSGLANLLEKADFLEMIKNAKEAQDILDYIKKEETRND